MKHPVSHWAFIIVGCFCWLGVLLFGLFFLVAFILGVK